MNSDHWIRMNRNTRLTLPVLTAVAMICGCANSYQPEQHRVDPASALVTLESVLSSWKQGDTPQSWRQRDPEVVIQDVDWNAGKQLEEFELLDAGEAVDANLHCRVKLTLTDAQQGEVEREVTYLVTTSPQLTVFRSMTP